MGSWTQIFDPISGNWYYSNQETGECVWEKPGNYEVDAKRISTTSSTTQVSRAEKGSWIKLYDSRNQTYYFFNPISEETSLTSPIGFTSSISDKRITSVIKIQCAYRCRIAKKRIKTKRKQREDKLKRLLSGEEFSAEEAQLLQKHQEDVVFFNKLKDAYQASIKIANRLEELTLSSDESEKYPKLSHLHVQHVQQFKQITAQQKTFKRDVAMERSSDSLPERLAELYAAYDALNLRVDDESDLFVEVDAARLSIAWSVWEKNKEDKIFTSKMFKSTVDQKKLAHLRSKSENALRKAMGSHGLETGVVKMNYRKFSDWHLTAKNAVTSVNVLINAIKEAYVLVDVFKKRDKETIERSKMFEEECNHRLVLAEQKNMLREIQQNAKRLLEYNSNWARGLKLRNQDRLNEKQEQEKIARKAEGEKQRLVHIASIAREKWMNRKVTLWEAVKEGKSIDAIQRLIEEETKKLERQESRVFRIDGPNPETGETLMQVACWWGHMHLVKFFAESGANIKRLDSFVNKFSLLHDASRAGQKNVVEFLLKSGLKVNIRDAYNETPLHWASRRNHFGTINAILKSEPLDEKGSSNLWKCIAAKNHRGKLASELTSNPAIFKILKDYEKNIPQHLYQNENPSDLNMNTPKLKRETLKAGRRVIIDSQMSQREITSDDRALLGKSSSTCSVDIKKRRTKELRVKKATARVVRILNGEKTTGDELSERFGMKWKRKVSRISTKQNN